MIKFLTKVLCVVFLQQGVLVNNMQLSVDLNGKWNGGRSHTVDALTLFCNLSRFDLIFKVEYAQMMRKPQPIASFYQNMYLVSVNCLNDILKTEKGKIYLKDFDDLLRNISVSGFDILHAIEVCPGGKLGDGAHRLAACVALRKEIPIKLTRKCVSNFDYQIFLDHNIQTSVADWGVLKYVTLNHNAYIVSLFPALNSSLDDNVDEILRKYGFIYYKKSLGLTTNCFSNLLRMFGIEDWTYENTTIDMAGAENGVIRIVVVVCDSLLLLKSLKKDMSALLDDSHFQIHVSYSRGKTVELAETYFNENSWFVMKHRPNNSSLKTFELLFAEFNRYLRKNHYSPEEFCAWGSTSLAVLGLRDIHDFDFIHLKNSVSWIKNKLLDGSKADGRESVILDPQNHFYFHGIKFATLEILKIFKEKENRERLKDLFDLRTISEYLFKRKNENEKMVKPDGKLIGVCGKELFVNSDGKLLGPDGEVLPLNDRGQLLGRNGKPVSVGKDGRILGTDGKLLSVGNKGRVVGEDGEVLPVEADGRLLGPFGVVLLYGADGNPLGPGTRRPTKSGIAQKRRHK